MNIEPIRYGVVGLGRAGWNIHVKQLRGREDARIVAAVDPLPERRQQAADEFGCRTYDSLGKLLKQDDVEVVIVATPSVQHGPDSKKALKTGKHVVVEKPMALGLAEADSMISTAREAGRKLFVHQNLRFSNEFLHLREVIESGILGRIFHIRCHAASFARRNDWQTLSKYGGGHLNNHGVHYLDQLLHLMPGRVRDAMGDLQQVVSAGDVEDHAKALLRSDTGCTVDLEVSMAENIAQPMPKWIVCGSCGTLTSNGKESTIRWFDPEQAAPLEVNEEAPPARKYGNEDKLPWQEKVVPAAPANQTGIGTFYDNVYAVLRRGEQMWVTPDSVREVMRVLGLIRKGTSFPGRPTRQKQAEHAGSGVTTPQSQPVTA
jgi:scyllo-inositol 2-dehydrogenase (NADP+)